MKIKLTKNQNNLGYISVDDRPSIEICNNVIVEPKKSLVLCGNPFDPHRINVRLDILSDGD